MNIQKKNLNKIAYLTNKITKVKTDFSISIYEKKWFLFYNFEYYWDFHKGFFIILNDLNTIKKSILYLNDAQKNN
jgi:hypothetical protein